MLPAPSPISYGTPVQAARSPSPEPSTKIFAANGKPARFGLDEHCVDTVGRGHHGAHSERMEQYLDAALRHELVRGDLERRNVVGLSRDLVANGQVGLVQAVHRAQAIEDVVGDPVHDLLVLAEHDAVQAAKRGQARGRAGPAHEAVALDDDRRAAAAARGDRRRNAGRAAAQDHDLVFAVERGVAAGL